MSQPEPIALMVAKARRYLHSAELLRQDGDYDSATSRLYYLMFYCSEALLLTCGLSFKKHQAVIAAFGQQFTKTKLLPADLHRWLLDAFDRRQRSDYEFASTITEAEVVELERQATEFLAQTEEFLKR